MRYIWLTICYQLHINVNLFKSLLLAIISCTVILAEAKSLKPASVYQRVCGVTPVELGAGGDMAFDGDEEWAYFRVG
ncbi:hypothetical protein [Arcticibacter svalbardensis]|uniref:hypothetical protein n=1 Tax=Arcticibacter svalbardensis TaxID=1288027 RepID=UPI00068F7CE2|nr:hypothetical protein [Arcticibacter svalbardensis]